MAQGRARIGVLAAALAALGIVAAASWVVLRTPAQPVSSAPRELRRDAPDSPDDVLPGVPGRPAFGATDAAQGAGGENEQGSEEGPRERDRIASGMAKLVADLEFTPGLPEPPQQVVRPQPEPWRGDPSREGPSPTIEVVLPGRAGTAGGTQAAIRGRNLRVVQVMFGATPARLVEASGTEVIVEVPPGPAGPAQVLLTNDDGTWAVASEPFVYGE